MFSIFSCICWSSVYLLWRNVYLGLLPIFLLGWFFVIGYMSCLYILEIKPFLINHIICKYFLSICRLSVLWFLLLCKNLKVWLGSIGLFLFLLPWKTDLRKHCYNFRECLTVFSSGSFMVSCLIFKSLSHFIVYGVREYSSNFIDLHAVVQLSHHHLLRRLSFLQCIFLLPLSKINWSWMRESISGLSILFHWFMRAWWRFVSWGLISLCISGPWACWGQTGSRAPWEARCLSPL